MLPSTLALHHIQVTCGILFTILGVITGKPDSYYSGNEDPHDLLNFGIMNTLENYTIWTEREVEISNGLRKRLSFNINLREWTAAFLKKYRVEKPSDITVGNIMSRYFGMATKYWRILENVSKGQKDLRIFSLGEKDWPGSTDLMMSLNGFVHVQEVHGLGPIQQSLDIQTRIRMTSKLDSEIGVFALLREKFNIAVEWLEMGISTMKSESQSKKSCSSNILTQLLSVSFQKHNRAGANWAPAMRKTYMENLYIKPVTKENNFLQNRIAYGERIYQDFIKKGGLNSAQVITFDRMSAFKDLCRKSVKSLVLHHPHLKCYYEQRNHPYLFINPVKVEKLYHNPPIFLFYEIVGNKTIDKLRNDTSPHLKPIGTPKSTRLNVKGDDQYDFWRTSVNTMKLVKDFVPTSVYSLMEMVTGLKILGSSKHNIYAEYTYGRYNGIHNDYFAITSPENTSKSQTDRSIATMLYYLELPEDGGSTAFCQVGITARPARGSVLFWYHLYRNGTVRDDVRHGGCCVLRGHKIVMTHWILESGNWDRFKCSLIANE